MVCVDVGGADMLILLAYYEDFGFYFEKMGNY